MGQVRIGRDRVLPRHYVPRPRLPSALAAAPIGLVSAGGGYGKSLLGAELVEALGLASATVSLAPSDSTPSTLVARMASALKRARLTDSAAAVGAEQADPVAAVDALSAALGRERGPVLLVLDDAHHLSPDAADLLARLAQSLPSGHRLLVLSRHPVASLQPLAFDNAVVLATADLAFTADEVVRLAERMGAVLAAPDALALQRATAGWAAALVAAGQRLARTGNREAEMTRIVEQKDTLRYLVSRQLHGLDEASRAAVVQLAHLPVLSPEVAAAVVGDERVLDAAGAVGIPLNARPDGWWEIVGPVREILQRAAPLQAATAKAAARAYAASGELPAALEVLLRSGQDDESAAMLAALSPQEADDLGYLELKTFIDAIPDEAVDAHPGALLHLARTCEPAAQVRLRTTALSRALEAATRLRDDALVRALEAERARDLVRDSRPGEAEELAARLLSQLRSGEVATRARLLDVLGRAAAWRRDGTSLHRAEPMLREAWSLCRKLGQKSWSSQVTMPLAHGVYFACGRHEQALDVIVPALGELPSRSPHRGVILSIYGDILVDCGRFAEAETAVEEGRRLGELLNDRRISAYAEWTGAKLASQIGDRQRTAGHVRATEGFRDDWFEHSTGASFLADAADLLDRVGEVGLAQAYLGRALSRQSEAPTDVAVANAAVLARSGDPTSAEAAVDEVLVMPRLELRERWRMTMLKAYAQWRHGQPVARATAAQAFFEVTALGKPSLPLVRERAVAEQLLDLVRENGFAAVEPLAVSDRPLTISVLGGFELRRAGQLVNLPPGRPEQVVKLLAVSGGRLPAEAVIEALWPEVNPDSGRKRLRNVLSRLRSQAGDAVVRKGEVLALKDAEIDADLFQQEAQKAITDGEVGTARLALARYRGPLLPHDPYAEWAAAPRERLARQALSLLDAAASACRNSGDVDEALRLIDLAIDLEPYEESRYLSAAQLLLEQGRRGVALSVLERATSALDELGMPPSAAHRELEKAIRA